jgi:hypothetical protein
MTPKAKYVAALALLLAGAVSAAIASTPARPERPSTGAHGALSIVGRRAQGAPAGVAGPWTMSYTTREGVKMTSTLTLAIEGDKMTGTVSSPRGSVPLDEVSVKGDEIAFAIVRVGFGDRIRIEYTGRIKGDTMTLKMKAGAKEPLDVTARRGAAGPP